VKGPPKQFEHLLERLKFRQLQLVQQLQPVKQGGYLVASTQRVTLTVVVSQEICQASIARTLLS
jgi:hypothetical protein